MTDDFKTLQDMLISLLRVATTRAELERTILQRSLERVQQATTRSDLEKAFALFCHDIDKMNAINATVAQRFDTLLKALKGESNPYVA